MVLYDKKKKQMAVEEQNVPGASSLSLLGSFEVGMPAKMPTEISEDEDMDAESQDEGAGSVSPSGSQSSEVEIDEDIDAESQDEGDGSLSPLGTRSSEVDMSVKMPSAMGSFQLEPMVHFYETYQNNPSFVELNTREYAQHLPLYRATLAGDWETTRQFIESNNGLVTAAITPSSDTILHIAVVAGKLHVPFMEKLVAVMSKKDLEAKNDTGNTALSMAAMVGNTAAAKILVRKNPGLLYISNEQQYLPVHEAARCAHKDMLVYLRQVTDASDDIGHTHFTHLIDVITAECYDVALDLIKNNPGLATMEVEGFESPLTIMSKKPSAFPSGTRLTFWERLVYSVLGLDEKLEKRWHGPNNRDIEKAFSHPRAHRMQVYAGICFKSVYRRLQHMLSEVLGFFAPHAKDKKVVNYQALELVKNLCMAIRLSDDKAAHFRCTPRPIMEAAINGIPEVIEEIVDALPLALWFTCNGHYILQMAVVSRSEKVFNLIYQMGDHKQLILKHRDALGNNILHLAGKLAPPHKLNLVSGAALQMQRELQWYTEVAKHIPDAHKLDMNSSNQTPYMVFFEEHKQLVIDGEKWMKDTATSCTIAAALIVTMVFAAAITIPGGVHQENGNPIFSGEIAFKLFFICNAISLFTSTTSLLMFLSILTARYAQQDFLFTLPNRLIIGLVSLFVSTTSMMISFSSTLYLVFGKGNTWSIIPTVGLACLPVTSFMTLQFPLLVDVISSTYGRGIFGKQSFLRL